MAGLDLSGVARVVDTWLVDQVEFVRDGGVSDDTLNPVTGQLIPTDQLEIYHDRGVVQALGGFSALDDPDTVRIIESTGADFRALLPMGLAGAIEFKLDDLVRVTAQNTETQDPLLTSRKWKVVDQAGVSSFSVLRVVYLKQVVKPGHG